MDDEMWDLKMKGMERERGAGKKFAGASGSWKISGTSYVGCRAEATLQCGATATTLGG